MLVLYNQTPLFTVDDLSDVDEIATMLSKESSDSPFIKSLSPATLHLLREGPKGEALEIALADDFNRMLTDPLFYRLFYKDSFFTKDLFTIPERDFANWLLMTLHEEGVFEKRADEIDERTLRNVIKLNRLFFIKKFGELLENIGTGVYIPKGDANRHTSKYVMFRELDAAGYKITKEMRLSAFFDAVIMTTKTH